MRPWEYWACDAYEYHLVQEIRAVVEDEIRAERRASQKDAEMMQATKPARKGGRGH